MDAALLHEARQKKKGRKTTIWSGMALLLVLMIVVVLISRVRPVNMSVVMGMAGSTAAVTLGMAWIMARRSATPGWAWWATGGVMAAGIMLSVFLVGDPVVWKKDVNVTSWMLPWFLLVMGTTRARRGAEGAPARPRAAWTLVGTGVVLTLLLLGLPLVVNRVFGA